MSDDPPDTVREKQGPKWWSSDLPRRERPELETVEPKSKGKKRGRKRIHAIITHEEAETDKAMINAIREVFGFGPLYGAGKPDHQETGPGLPIHDPDAGGRQIGKKRTLF